MGSQLAPGFLVAAPSLLDPNFARSVVLLVDHRPEGSLGFVVNRPAQVGLRGMIEPLGLDLDEESVIDSPVLVGGPVQPSSGWLVYERADGRPTGDEVIEVSDKLLVSASREMLADMVTKGDAGRLMLVLGYAGWGPGQLDEEIAQGAWIPVGLDETIVFDTPYDDRWTAALRLLGIDPARLAPTTSAQN